MGKAGTVVVIRPRRAVLGLNNGFRLADMAGRARRDSTARARELGGELKGARERVRLKAAELAEILGWSPTKLSRVESGSRGVSEVDAARYLASCRVPRGEVNRLLDLARETDDGYRLRPHGRRSAGPA